MISLDELTHHLGLDPDTEDTEMLVVLEREAVDRVQRVTDRYWGPPEETVEYVDGTGTRGIYLREEPVEDPAPIVKRETSPGVWETVSSSEYVIRGRRLIHTRSVWCRGRENYEVTYTRGYAAAEVPEQVRMAVKREVSRMYAERGSEGVKSETYGGYSYTSAGAGDGLDELRADLEGLVRPVYA